MPPAVGQPTFYRSTGALTRVRQAALGYESLTHLSDQHSRILGTGPSPFQDTPDGTCIRLDALRIRNTLTDSPEPFGSHPPRPITPTHLSSDGQTTLITTDADGRNLILRVASHNDADHDGIPDDWEKDFATFILTANPEGTGLTAEQRSALQSGNLDADTDYTGDGITTAEEFALGTDPNRANTDGGGPDATPDDLDGDGVPNGEDAGPWDSLIDWKASGTDRFAVIEMPAELLSTAGQTEPRVIGIDEKANVLLATQSNSSNAQGGGFWKVGENAFEAVAAVSVTYEDPRWSNLTRSSTGLCGMAGDALIYQADAPVDYNFGGALVAAPGKGAYGFWPAFRAINGEAYAARALGGDIHGTTYCYIDNEGAIASHGFPSGLYLLGQPINGGPTLTQAATFSDFENADQHSLLAVTRQGWVAFHDQILHPAQELSLASPGTSGDYGWIQDLPERSKASASVALRASAPVGGILIPDKNDAWQAPKAFEGQQIIAAMPNGVFINSRHELWTRDRRDKRTDPTDGNWLPPRHWAGDTFADLIEDGWEPSYNPRAYNSSGAFAVHLKKAGETSRVHLLLPVEVVPDYNRDGKITDADRGKVSDDNPWRFWRNSDDDSGTEGGDDIPGAGEPDYQGSSVDGVRDLVDFFPVHFDLKSVLDVLPETEYQYFLKHESQSFYLGGAVPVPSFNVLWYPEAELEADPSGESGIGSYLNNLARAQDIAGRPCNTIPQNGLQIPEEMLTAAKDGKCVALFESRQSTDNPIVIEIRKNDGSSVAKIEMPVKILEVEGMFRSKFLNENLGGGTQGGVPAEPGNWPDADRNGKHFIFVHGYNVNVEQARGWHSEMFKRMFWSGSDAMFTGVSWHGSESQILGATPDYWRNVHNAFQTSKSMADFVNALPGGGKCIAAHSLGSIVVSSAIKDHGLSVANYYMVDAAAAIEAYSLASTLGNAEMSHPDWRVYDKKLWCSEWHKIFPATDNRHKMTWRDRFGVLLNTYNFHSTGEEVLKNGDGTVPGAVGVATSRGVRAWVKQEMSKGFSIGSGGGLFHNGTGGWDFNGYWYIEYFQYPYLGPSYRRRTPVEAATIPLTALEGNPFFDPFVNGKFHDPALGSAEAAKYDEVSKALAESLPSLTFAAGANPIQVFNTRNFDMMDMRNGWPPTRVKIIEGTELTDWRHSDLRNIAYIYTRKVFDKFVELGELNQ